MEYREAIEYLHQLQKFGINLGLGRMEALLRRLGNPQLGVPFIHIAGTNGKGSVAAMVSSVLRAAGLRTGRYISPSLQSFNERISVGGTDIGDGELAALITELRPAVAAVAAELDHPTEFEVATAAAFCYFRAQKAEIGVLEVGMGGRLDSTNVIPPPLAAVITHVAYDHMEILGPTLRDIAREKAGIIKDGGAVVTAVQAPEVRAVIAEACRQHHARLWQAGEDITWREEFSGPEGQGLTVATPGRSYPGLRLRLLGRHQLENAATAVGAIEAVRERGLAVAEEAVRRGLADATWPGRLEVMEHNPTVVLDGAHNPDGARVLRQALEEVFAYDRLILVLGILRDKAYPEMMATLAPLAHTIILTRSGSPRAADPGELRPEAEKYCRRVRQREKIPVALELARELAGPRDMICIAGSLYTVGEARACWKNRNN